MEWKENTDWSITYKRGKTLELVLKSDGNVLRTRREEGERNAQVGFMDEDKVKEIKTILDTIEKISTTRTALGTKYLNDQEALSFRSSGLQEVLWSFGNGNPPPSLVTLYFAVKKVFAEWIN